ncbi:MAG: SDR family NAD(P)-dependent oxidoreductase [Candidatus Geothermincolia bacterium]
MKDLTGKIVLVTGAARGMGRLHAENFCKEGCRVVITDVDRTALAEAAGEMTVAGYDVSGYLCDISDRAACMTLAEQVTEEVGPLDILVNNAGITQCEELLSQSEAAIRRITDVNYLGQVWMIQAFVPAMMQRKSGHVVNVASYAGKIGTAYLAAYCATKWALIGLTDSLRQECSKNKVRFTIVNPGYIKTGMFEGCKVPPLTRWQDPNLVSAALIKGVKKNRYEVFWPRWLGHLVSLGRGLAIPKVTDPLFYLLRVNKSFSRWQRSGGRPF